MNLRPPLRLVLLIATALLRSPVRADDARLSCIADTAVSSYPGEQDNNYGQSSRLRLKGIQSMALMDFDTKPVSGWTIQKATLFLRYGGADRKLRTLGISTVAAPWSEGTGSGEKRAGESCFGWRELGRKRWRGPQTDLTDVTFRAAGTLASYADIVDKGDGWFAVSIEPGLVQAMVAGLTHGLCITDEKGQTAANNDVYSREQNNSQPYLVVEGRPAAAIPAGVVGNGRATANHNLSDLDSAAVTIEFDIPASALGYEIRYAQEGGTPEVYSVHRTGRRERAFLIGLAPARRLTTLDVYTISATGDRGAAVAVPPVLPTAVKAPPPLTAPAPRPGVGVPLTAGPLRVWAYPDTEKAHPVSGNLLEESGAGYAGPATGSYRTSNAAWNGKSVILNAARGEIVAFHLCVEAAGGAKGISILPPRTFTKGSAANAPGFPVEPAVYRDWYVKQGEWVPEACVPLRGSFEIPAADNAVPNQRNQSVLVELLVPKTAPPANYHSILAVKAGSDQLFIPIDLQINSLTMPDRLSFDVSLNGYGIVGHYFGMDDRTPEYRALEREYHRLAHSHRTTLALLGYSHSGTTTSNYAPPLSGDGANMRVTDWTDWDAQFGPYVDGSAFKGLPRDGVPISHLYLPFHEAWPGDIRAHYHYTPTVLEYPATITEHALKAPPIEQAMNKEMADAFTGVTRQFAQHFHEKGWKETVFQFYQNDKHYYKDPKQGGRGTSWWLLDEPNYRDDWLALAYFARLFRKGTEGFPDVKMVHREDISRPQWQRDYLDGLVDLMVTSGELFQKQPLMRETKERLGVTYWNYGTANDPKVSNLEMPAWAIKAWLASADAVVPWNSIGGDENYTTPEATALLLPGKRFGITGPVASLRLKALRRAQQDVEYLVALAKSKGWSRDQVAAAISGMLDLKLGFQQTDADDAGRYRFGALNAERFDALRRAVAAEIAR